MSGDAHSVVEAFRARRLDPATYAASVLERAAAARDLNALVALDGDLPDKAAAAFRANPDAPLAGLPIVVKDNIPAQGFPTKAGTPALAETIAAEDAPVLAKLRGAGAVVAAKATMHELALGITSDNGWTGAVKNPADPTRIPGGSSGGTAAAIAAGIVAAGLGSDTGGSCRIPAALCGIVGFRPSSGRYDGCGFVPISRTKDTPGPMARSVRDIVLLDGVMAGDAAPLDQPAPSTITLGVPRAGFWDDLSPEVAAAAETALAALGRAGVRIVEVDLSDYAALNADCGGSIALYEIHRDLPDWLAEHAPGVTFDDLRASIASPDVAALLSDAHRVPRDAYERAMRDLRPKMRQIYLDAFEAARLDAIVFPTTPLTACPVGDTDTTVLNGRQVPVFPTYIRNTDPASNIGAPGLSLPLPVSGLPVGLEIDARPGDDARLLAAASALESLFANL